MNSVILIIFLLYSFFIVFIKNIYVILCLLLLEFILLCFLKIKCNLKNILIFILFIFLINFLLVDFNTAVVISLRLLTMYLIVIIVINKIGVNNIARSFANLFHSKEVYLIISLALTFIPIMKDEVINVKKALIVKNYPLTFKNVLKNPKVFIISFINNLFTKVSEIENVLIATGFDE